MGFFFLCGLGFFWIFFFFLSFSEKYYFAFFYGEEEQKGLERLSYIDIASAIHTYNMILIDEAIE